MFLAILLYMLHTAYWAIGQGGGGDAVGGALGWFSTRPETVGLVVEVGKEYDEGDGIGDERPLHPGWEWAAGVQRVSRVTNSDMELDL